jgi:CheY-like chemotaxis protein
VLDTERAGIDRVTLDAELDFVRDYLELESLRLGERLRVEWDLDPDLGDCLVPALSLQPLVENSIKHAFNPFTRHGILRIESRREPATGLLRVTVRDDGPGAAAATIEASPGLGIRTIGRRLDLDYAGRAAHRLPTRRRLRRLRHRAHDAMTTKTVFFAEDEPLARDVLRDAIYAHPGLRLVGEAADGASALARIGALRPDVVFMDIQMPEMTGLEVLRQLDYLPQIVFTTAYDHYAVARSSCTPSTTCSSRSRGRALPTAWRACSMARGPNASPSKMRWCVPVPGRRRSIASSCATVDASFPLLRTRSNT